MGMTRLSSDGSLPNRNWKSFYMFLPNDTTLQAQILPNLSFGLKPPVYCERALIRVSDTSPGPIRIGPRYPGMELGTLWVELAPKDEYELTAQPGTTFDITEWFAQSTAPGTNNVLTVIYQG